MPSDPLVRGDRVRELYEAKGWSQQELAWRANLSLPTVSRAILGNRGAIQVSVLYRLAVVLNTSTDYLLGLTEDKRARSG